MPLILVVAPPGYGKTTALSQWAAQERGRFAWVTVDEADDPARLIGHIALALHRIEPLDSTIWTSLATQAPIRSAVVPRLVAALRARAPVVLVLDGLHRLHAASMDVILALAVGLPPGSHIALVSRSRRNLYLGRLRSDQRCVEFGPDDLAFTAPEARAVLAEVGVQCSDDVAEALVRRTEGWPAGVYLAALALRDRADPDAVTAVGRLAGDDMYIVDYFDDVILAREPAETVQFLLHTAPLEQLSGPLCDAVLGTANSAGRLAELESRNLFVVPLDRHGEWYRYHRLFAEMLLSELRRREPDRESQIHRRAAAWYGERSMPDQAIAHALAGHDVATASRLISLHAPAFVVAGQFSTVRRWLEAMDDDALQNYPPLAVAAAWAWALGGDLPRAQHCVLIAQRGSFTGPPPDGTASLASAIALFRAATAPLGVDRMLADAQFAFELEPPGSQWHPLAAVLLGAAHVLTGSPALAAKEFDHLVHLGIDQARPAIALALAERSLLAADQDDWSTADARARESWDVIERGQLHEFVPTVLTYVARARVATHRGDPSAARRYAGNALRMSGRPSAAALPWLTAQVAITLGRIFLHLDDMPAARLRNEEARRQLTRLLTEGVLRDEQRRLAFEIARRGGRTRAQSAMALSTAEMRVLHLLQTHLSLAEIAEELFVSRNTVKSQVAAAYRKLGASTRSEAVRRGRELGLLEQ